MDSIWCGVCSITWGKVVHDGALILLEIGAGQGERTAAYARAVLPRARVDVLLDYAGHDRIVRVAL